MIELLVELLTKAFRGVYPIECDSLAVLVTPGFPRQFATADELVGVVEPMLRELEAKLKAYETQAN